MKNSFCILATALAAVAAHVAIGEVIQVGVVPKSKDGFYWQAVHAGATQAAADLSKDGNIVKVIWDGPAREDQIDLQKQIVARLVDQKVNAIVLAPVNAQALVAPVDDAKNGKIPVVVIDSPLGSESPVSTVATNNYKAGLLAGRRLAEVLNGKGNVALFRYLKGHGSTQPRESGFLDALKKFPGIHVVSADVHSGATQAEAEKNATDLLAHVGGDIQGVFASNLQATLGMLGALRAGGQVGKIAFVGFDSDDTVIEAIRKGDMAGTAVQQPFMMGYLGVQTAVQAVHGKSVDKEVDTDVKIVTKENLDTAEVKKLLNPGSA